MKLRESLKVIESYKKDAPHYFDLLDVLSGVLILREDFSQGLAEDIFTVEERYVASKLSGGMPLVDISKGVNFAPAERYFRLLVDGVGKKFPDQTDVFNKYLTGEISYRDLLLAYQLIGADGASDAGTSPKVSVDEPEAESGLETIDLLEMLLRESLRPGFELVVKKYSSQLAASQWSEGFCPVCGSDPKIGEIKGEEGHRHLYCLQCGYEWIFPRIMCPFCGNDDHQTLLYFTVSGNENHRVDTCNQCKQYVKMVDIRDKEKEVNLDIEDIATLHLDIIAAEEGYE